MYITTGSSPLDDDVILRLRDVFRLLAYRKYFNLHLRGVPGSLLGLRAVPQTAAVELV